MQSKVFVITLVIVGSMFGYSSGQCQAEQPMETYTPDLVQGKFFLVASQKAFSYQTMEANCGTCEIEDPSQKFFPYVITFQDPDGSSQKITLSVENVSPPGTFNVTGGNGIKFQGIVLGALKDKVHILYGCNPQNGQAAVWVYYSSRVAGINNMDANSQQYVKTILSNNNIPVEDVQDINNNDCNS